MSIYAYLKKESSDSLPPPCLTINGTGPTCEYKYLGVTITSDLSWSPHIANLYNKTRKIIGVFYKNSNSSTLLKLYLSHIRPHLEYCSAVWNPHLKGDIAELEKVQKFALRVCTKSWDTSYDELLAASKLPSLESRRNHTSIRHLFKIINELTYYHKPATVSIQQQVCRFKCTYCPKVSHLITSTLLLSFNYH